MKWKAMTFNLRYNEPRDGENAWPYRIGRAAQMIRAHAPDLFGTQEGLYSMLNDLKGELEEYGWIGTGRNGGQEGEHCAIFYRKDRFEVTRQGQFWLSETPDVPASKSWDSSLPRICTWGEFRERESGKSFLFYNTHLDHRGSEARLNGIKLVYESMEANRRERGLPAVLTGDMNCTPDSEPIRFLRGELEAEHRRSDLKDAFAKAAQPVGRTYNGFKGLEDGQPIDYIFVSPDVEVISTVVDRSQYGGGYPSDHYPVAADLRI